MFKFGYNKLPKPLVSKPTISEDKNILDGHTGIAGMIHSYVNNPADNPFRALDTLDNNARYMLFNDKNKSSNINILA
jgi:hypothetical protein